MAQIARVVNFYECVRSDAVALSAGYANLLYKVDSWQVCLGGRNYEKNGIEEI